MKYYNVSIENIDFKLYFRHRNNKNSNKFLKDDRKYFLEGVCEF